MTAKFKLGLSMIELILVKFKLDCNDRPWNDLQSDIENNHKIT
jgi:hypothetical protein